MKVCRHKTEITVCKHVAGGTPPAVLVALPEGGLSDALCNECDTEIWSHYRKFGNSPEEVEAYFAAHPEVRVAADMAMQETTLRLMKGICRCCAADLGLPLDITETTYTEHAKHPS